MSNLAKRITDLEHRVSAIEAVVGIDYPGPSGPAKVAGNAGPRIPAGARVFFTGSDGTTMAGVVTDAPPDGGKYLIELADGEQVWVHEHDMRGSADPGADHPVTNPST